MKLLSLVLVLTFGAAALGAQSTATLEGTVTDAQGAVMPGVSLTIRNDATGVERASATDQSGKYVAASLPPGTYSVVAHIDGFQDQKGSAELGVAQTVAVNFRMTVGAIARRTSRWWACRH